MRIIDYALSDRGSYPGQRSCKTHGHGSYLGQKRETARAYATPTEGPLMKHHYNLFRNYIDTRYVSKATSLLNELAQTTYWAARPFYRPLDLIDSRENFHICLCALIIWTKNFDCIAHLDKNDWIVGWMVNQLEAQAKALIKNKNLPATERNLMLNFLVFLDDF